MDSSSSTSSGSGLQQGPLRKFLGVSSLIQGKKDTRKEVSVASLEGKPLLLLFSGQWCPSCRLFKPKLMGFYKRMKEAKKDFEVIYITQDRSEEEFEVAFESAPWLALPLKEKRSHTRLSAMCQIDGVPKLVLVNPKGKIVTTDARKLMAKDPDGEKFPWVPPTVFETLEGVPAFTHDMRKIDISKQIKEKEGGGFALYFAASFVRQCRFTTPRLVTTYQKMKESGVEMEILLCPIERDQEAFDDFWAEMPFPTLQPSHKAMKQLREVLGINHVPSLVTIDSKTGEVINHDATSLMEEDPEGHRFPWKPRELPPVSRFYPSQDVVAAVHENICCVMYLNGASNKSTALQEFSRAAVLWDATRNAEVENSGDKVRFFTVDDEDSEKNFLNAVLRSLRLKAPEYGTAVLLLCCLVNQDRQLIPAASLDGKEVSKRVEAFKKRQGEQLGDNNNDASEEEKSASASATAAASSK